MDIVSSPLLSLQPCQLLITVDNTIREIRQFVILMKLRAYFLFASQKWSADTEHTTPESKAKAKIYKFNLSFIKYSCIFEGNNNYLMGNSFIFTDKNYIKYGFGKWTEFIYLFEDFFK